MGREPSRYVTYGKSNMQVITLHLYEINNEVIQFASSTYQPIF